MAGRVTVEWRRGLLGDQGTYTFDPRPNITRSNTGQKLVEFKIPLKFGSHVQELGKDSEVIVLRGVLVEPDILRYDYLDKKRRDLITGLGTSVGQLHLTSNLSTPESEHIYYKGIVRNVEWAEQTNSQILEYTINILLSDPTETIV